MSRTVILDSLRHMQQAVAAIESYTSRGRAAFDADPAVRDAVLYQLVILGEAAKSARASLLRDQSLAARVDTWGIEWSPIARMRDRVAHHYWTTDAEIVWATASTAVPPLAARIDAAIAEIAG